MEPPMPQPQGPPLSTTPHLPYQDSIASSPRSRKTESMDDGVGSKLRLMCSYGGQIVPRPHDKSLCYVGGDTRMVVVDRHGSLSDLSSRLSKTLLQGRLFTLKYQIPGDDLDSLISVTSDEDLENMIEEYDRIFSSNLSLKSPRIRLFLFPKKHDSSSSTIEVGSIFNNSSKSEDWFVSALNGSTGALNGGFTDSQSVNSLLGLDNDMVASGYNGGSFGSRELDNSQTEFDPNTKNLKQGNHDVPQVPDSPMFETTSSFGSTSSQALANLPAIHVHVEDTGGGGGVKNPDLKKGIEEQFANISVAAQKQDEGFTGLSSPPPPPPPLMQPPIDALPVTSAIPVSSAVGGGEFRNPVVSDNESLEQVMPVRPPQPQSQTLLSTMNLPHQPQQKPIGGVELPSTDSTSSYGNRTNVLYHQNPTIYQEPIAPQSMNIADPNTPLQIHQQVQESEYIMQPHLEQQQQQQRHYIQGGVHYISHHHPSGQVPMSSYYAHPPPQQLDHQYPVMYYVPTRQPQQAYNFPIQQPNFPEPLPTTPSNQPQPTIPTYNVPPKTETAAGAYRPAAAGPQLVQVSQNQHHQQQYVTANYAYEFADPAHPQMYYTQPYAPSLVPAQYQTMTAASAIGLPEASHQPLSDQMKQPIKTKTTQV